MSERSFLAAAAVVVAGVVGVTALPLSYSDTPETNSSSNAGSPSDSSNKPAPAFPGATGADELIDSYFEIRPKKEYDLHSLIALVPDPVDSVSGYLFDSMTEAIRLALERHEFVLDRYYYPWLTPDGKRTSPPVPTSLTDKEIKRSPPRMYISSKGRLVYSKRVYDKQPGLLLFRGTGKRNSKQVVAVFLVGETATKGVHTEAMTSALHSVWNWKYGQKSKKHGQKCKNHNTNDTTFHILGPSFSGSQDSLAHTIRKWRPKKPKNSTPNQNGSTNNKPPYMFRVISGSATAVNIDTFENQAGLGNKRKVCFQATVIPEHIILAEMLHHLGLLEFNDSNLKHPYTFNAKIAYLCESNTGFGAAVGEKIQPNPNLTNKEGKKIPKKKHGQKRKEECDENPVTSKDTHKDEDQNGKTGEKLVQFPFPLHISNVRSGYGIVKDAVLWDWPNLPTFGARFRLPFGKIEHAREVQPILHPGMSAVTSERILTNMLATIRQEGFQYAVITATSIKDRLFLASLLRKHCPDVNLLFTSNDLLLSHPDVVPFLKGSVVGSTYPLYSKNQTWSFPFQGNKQRISFSSEFDEGYYNAAVALLWESLCLNKDQPCRLLDYGPPFTKGKTNTSGRRPPIWISIIGENGPQPLAVVSKMSSCKLDRKYRCYVYRSKGTSAAKPSFTPRYTAFLVFAFLGICSFVGYVSYCALISKKKARGDSDSGSLEDLFRSRRDKTASDKTARGKSLWVIQRILTIVCLLATLVLVLCTLPSWIPVWCCWLPGANVEMARWHRVMSILTMVAVGAVIVAIVSRIGWPNNADTNGVDTEPANDKSQTGSANRNCKLHRVTKANGDPANASPDNLTTEQAKDTEETKSPESSEGGEPDEVEHTTNGSESPESNGGSVPTETSKLQVDEEDQTETGAPEPNGGNEPLETNNKCESEKAPPNCNDNQEKNGKKGPGKEADRDFVQWVSEITHGGFYIMLAIPILLIVLNYFWWNRNLCFSLGIFGLPWDKKLWNQSSFLLLFERTTRLIGGVNPLVPIGILALGFFLWGWVQLRRLFLHDKFSVKSPFPMNDENPEFVNLDNQCKKVESYIESGLYHDRNREQCKKVESDTESPGKTISRKATWIILVIILSCAFGRLIHHYVPTVEGSIYDNLLFLGLMILAVFIVKALLELLRLWKELRQLLQAIARLPMREAFARVPRRITAVFGPYLSSHRPNRESPDIDRCKEQGLLLKELREIEKQEGIDVEVTFSKHEVPEELINDLRNHLQEVEKHRNAEKAENKAVKADSNEVKSCPTTAQKCFSVLNCFWKDLSLDEALADPPPPSASEGASTSDEEMHLRMQATREQRAQWFQGNKALQRWCGLAEEFVALEVVNYLSQFFVQMKGLVIFLTIAPILLLFAVASYPLQPQRLWLLFCYTIILAVAICAIYVFVQLESNDVVSRISGSAPNRINFLHWSFVQNLLLCVVPLLGALATSSPTMVDFVRSAIGPFVHTLK